MFEESNRAEAAHLLSEDCTPQTMHSTAMTDNDIERCHFAALKLSGGNLESLVNAVAMAQTDDRDLLMAAGFGDDILAHLDWLPND